MNRAYVPAARDEDPIADIQGSPDARRMPIDKVGIKGIRHPVRVRERSGGEQHSVATFDMYVSLPDSLKGTHMSRFVEILNRHEHAMGVESFRNMLTETAHVLDAQCGYVEMRFPYFMRKRAPISGVESLMDYEVILHGEFVNGVASVRMTVKVPVTSLCPCSKEISDYGAHNQRSEVTLTVSVRECIWIEELVELVEEQASCELFGLLKRPDEKYVTERAYDNPKFVEDMVRDVAGALNRDARIGGYVVESENFESIHNHSAYARLERSGEALPGGARCGGDRPSG